MIRSEASAAWPLVVVAAPGQELPPLPEGVLLARDPVEGRGPLQGIAAGLDAIAPLAERAYVASTDAPFLHPAFVRRLAPALSKRFGDSYERTGMYPIPILTRDIPGYLIRPHTDTHWKGITVQLYLPADEANINIGTIFHDQLPDGSRPKHSQMRFAPNSGYAFAVDTHTWHSADPVGPEVKTRDSILLTYFVDSGLLRVLRNRGKRVGNLVMHEVKNLTGIGGAR